jgi:outer membrane protein TolC
MWSITATFNIPLYFRSRQGQALAEARAMSYAAEHELLSARTMTASQVRDTYAMLRSAEELMELYRQGLLPKTMQDFELSLAGYRTGKVEGITVVSRLKALIEYELSYWAQFTEREKAIARLEALTGAGPESGLRSEE